MNIACPHCQETITLERTVNHDTELSACRGCFNPYIIKKSNSGMETIPVPGVSDFRIGATAESLAGQVMDKLAGSLDKLPVLPAIAQRVLEVTQDEDSSMQDLALVIEEDTVMSAKVLTVSNSALYGGLTQITDLSGACTRLGMNTVSGIVQTVANENLYTSDNPDALEAMQKLWHHAVATSYLSNEIAKLISSPFAGTLHLAGLVHDIGKIALIDIIYKAKDGPLLELQSKPELFQEIISRYHTIFGLHIVLQWNLPPELAMAVYYHHNPEQAPSENWKSIAHTVALANATAHVSGWGSEYTKDVSLMTFPSAAHFSIADIKLATMRVDLDDKMESLLGALKE